jgi:hypothetical protein
VHPQKSQAHERKIMEGPAMKPEDFVKNNLKQRTIVSEELIVELVKEYAKHVVTNAVLLTLKTCDDPSTGTLQSYIDKIYKEVTK